MSCMLRRSASFSALYTLAVLALLPMGQGTAATRAVGNCNDSGAGSLRATVANALSGDTIDMSGLVCRRIYLTSGAIAVPQNDLSLVGGPPRVMTVDAARHSPVFRHSGTGKLYMKRMDIARGYISDTQPKGGCLYSAGNVELVDSIVRACRAKGTRGVVYASGGGIYASGTVKLVHSRVVDNAALFGYGGAIRAGGGVTAFRSRICRNRVTGGSGVVNSYNGVVVRYTTVCDNQGGGVWAQNGNILIANSTVSGNVGSSLLFLSAALETESVSIVNSTISGNTDTWGTPIVDMQREAPKSIVNSTIAFNQQLGNCDASVGTVRVMGSEPALLDSTIISGNLCNGTPGSAITRFPWDDATLAGADNLIVGPSNMDLPPDTISTDPRLAPLADNGGAGKTHALPADSPAIDSGNNEAGLTYDQRGEGHPRTKGAGTDIGAYER